MLEIIALNLKNLYILIPFVDLLEVMIIIFTTFIYHLLILKLIIYLLYLINVELIKLQFLFIWVFYNKFVNCAAKLGSPNASFTNYFVFSGFTL